MGRSRPKPTRLAGKLAEIRSKLGLSQNEMIRRLGLSDQITQNRISAYELGEREPPLYVLLAYARACGSGEFLEHLIDDEMELPEQIPIYSETGMSQRKQAIK
ncbi:MAG TPA: helix-turn-helix transcriptional regulator [Pyrinomonadaceae bacterium]|nr:helix-turn-helix transcriptional regulator [Pyrinomonadaceae bacterium]